MGISIILFMILQFSLGKVSASGNSNLVRFTRNVAGGGATAIKIGDAEGNRTRTLSVVPITSNDHPCLHSISYLDDAGNTSSRYYNYAFAHGATGDRTMKINAAYNVSNSFLYSVSASTLTAMEVSA